MDNIKLFAKDEKELETLQSVEEDRKNTDNTSVNRTKITRKQKWEEKQLYGNLK